MQEHQYSQLPSFQDIYLILHQLIACRIKNFINKIVQCRKNTFSIQKNKHYMVTEVGNHYYKSLFCIVHPLRLRSNKGSEKFCGLLICRSLHFFLSGISSLWPNCQDLHQMAVVMPTL